MTDVNIFTPGKLASVGTISGFTIDQASDPTFVETIESVAQILTLLRDLKSKLGPVHIRQLESLIISHIRNFNNPHRVTMDQVVDDFVGGFLGQYLAGSVPKDYPIVSMDALTIDLNTFANVSVSRAGELNIIDRQGFLSYIGENILGVDWSFGEPTIPCWPDTTQYLSDVLSSLTSGAYSLTNLTQSETVVNEASGIVPDNTDGKFKYSFNGTDATSVASLVITPSKDPTPPTLEQGWHCVSFFVKPAGAKILQIALSGTVGVDTIEEVINFDFASGEISGDSQSTLWFIPLPNGWYRIGAAINLTAVTVGQTNPAVALTSVTLSASVTQYDLNDATLTPPTPLTVGTATATDLFYMYGPQLTNSKGIVPFIQSGSLAATTVTIPGYGKAQGLAELMFAFRAAVCPAASGTLFKDTKNVLSVSVAPNYVTTVGVAFANGVVSGTAKNTNRKVQFFSLSGSVSETALLVATTAGARETLGTNTGQQIPELGDIAIGPFDGQVSAFSLYAIADNGSNLEFLIDEQ